MESIWQYGLLIVNTVAVFFIGWLLSRFQAKRSLAKRKLGNEAVDEDLSKVDPIKLTKCKSLLIDVQKDIGGHSVALKDFSIWLCDSTEQHNLTSESWAKQVLSLRQANTKLDEQLRVRESGFTTIPANIKRRVNTTVSSLPAYRNQTAELTETIDRLDDEHESEGIRSQLSSDVEQLLRENSRLHAKLTVAEKQIAEQSAQIAEAKAEARVDALTELPNRRSFEEKLSRVVESQQRYRDGFVLVLLDIDHFKQLNDIHGHRAGDLMLQTVSRVLRRTCRATDYICRFGGEEFAIILTRCNPSHSGIVAERYRKSIEAGMLMYEGKELRVTASFGFAHYIENETAEVVIERADAALYAAKRSGRNRVFMHDGSKTVAANADSSESVVPEQQPEKLRTI